MTFPTDIATEIVALPITVRITSAHRGSPGTFNPRDGGCPPEPPEVEFRVLLTAEGRESLDITEYLTDEITEALHDELVETLENEDV